MNKFFITLILSVSTAVVACDDDTSIVGIGIMPDGDNITPYSKVYPIVSSTYKVDSVLANTKTCYLGSIIDPDTHVKTTSDFLAQFHVPENFKLPQYESMIKDDKGQIIADSCDIQIFFDSYFGDSLATMKLDVQELSKQNILEESTNYYTNIDPKLYLDPSTEYKKSITYTIKDLARPNNKEEKKRITINLPTQYGARILNEYYNHPEFFKNSYQFIHHICPGFYFQQSGGIGSMITTKNMALNVYFKHTVKLTEEKDTIIDGMQRFGATEEVIQCTAVDNQYPGNTLDQLLKQENCTYVKTPASFFTEMQLPITQIVGGEHYKDTINLAQINIRKYNSENPTEQTLKTPTYLLMVRKANYQKFFEKRSMPDHKESFLSSKFNTRTNTYNYSNISQLITFLKNERDLGANILPSDSESERMRKYKEWESAHPDWDKVLLIPVKAIFTTATDYYGQPIEKLQSIQHDLGLTSARLEGGKAKPINIKIIYTRFNQ